MFRNTVIIYDVQLLAPRPTSKLKDHPVSAFRDCVLNIFAATLHVGGRSSTANLRTRHLWASSITGLKLAINSTPKTLKCPSNTVCVTRRGLTVVSL